MKLREKCSRGCLQRSAIQAEGQINTALDEFHAEQSSSVMFPQACRESTVDTPGVECSHVGPVGISFLFFAVIYPSTDGWTAKFYHWQVFPIPEPPTPKHRRRETR